MSLETLLGNVVALLEARKCTYALAGGLVSSLYRTQPRTTDDIDFLLDAPDGTAELGVALVRELGLEAHVISRAQLDGGPKFAMKRRSGGDAMVLGRPLEKKTGSVGWGVDFLLSTLPWVPRALERAQHHRVDFGFGAIPCLTLEDLITSKLISCRDERRFKDLDDLASIFDRQDFDVSYVLGRMDELGIIIPVSAKRVVPPELMKRSNAIARRLRAQ
ncbi:MAG: nucleotidyl transferase AbiEii/AbiGii toxin family protein [Deltaproteobacteria bacterium]|nr:nucleotidyl transferase AbiEii/AbiGii toxin family protein [Deltaproteobacteria bacterium]